MRNRKGGQVPGRGLDSGNQEIENPYHTGKKGNKYVGEGFAAMTSRLQMKMQGDKEKSWGMYDCRTTKGKREYNQSLRD